MTTSVQDKKQSEICAAEQAKEGAIIPYSSIQIYADLKEFNVSLKTILCTRKSERPVLLSKIESLFKDANGQPAEMLVTVSARTAWSLFLEVLHCYLTLS